MGVWLYKKNQLNDKKNQLNEQDNRSRYLRVKHTVSAVSILSMLRGQLGPGLLPNKVSFPVEINLTLHLNVTKKRATG